MPSTVSSEAGSSRAPNVSGASNTLFAPAPQPGPAPASAPLLIPVHRPVSQPPPPPQPLPLPQPQPQPEGQPIFRTNVPAYVTQPGNTPRPPPILRADYVYPPEACFVPYKQANGYSAHQQYQEAQQRAQPALASAKSWFDLMLFFVPGPQNMFIIFMVLLWLVFWRVPTRWALWSIGWCLQMYVPEVADLFMSANLYEWDT
ncbi:hypothetical protein F4805DRAFT_476323 [Annulohypoxylon moriforme]|nr:hypothetical protein F4805DRAFT_476323 [Annulohypoxylon moriforme]